MHQEGLAVTVQTTLPLAVTGANFHRPQFLLVVTLDLAVSVLSVVPVVEEVVPVVHQEV